MCRFSRKKELSNLNNKNIEIKTCDLRTLTEKDLENIDFIAHLAWITNIPNSIKNPLSTTNDTINMTANLLDKATKANIKKVVFPSTASLYGNNPVPWTENMGANPIEPYSWQKLSCEYLLKMWNERYSLKSCSLRLFQVFGEPPRPDSALHAFLSAKKNGTPITLTETTAQSSFRSARRDFIYVKDVAKAFIKAMESNKTGRGEIINIGSGKTNTMEEIAMAIGGEIKFIPRRPHEVEVHLADLENTNNLIDWKAETNVIEWLKNYVSK